MKIKYNPNNKIQVFLKNLYVKFRYAFLTGWLFTAIWAPIKTRFNLLKNKGKSDRQLEIGTDARNLINGFETLSVHEFINIDYVVDASRRLPFEDNAFALVYASHVLEHIPWYKSESVLKEWFRILKHGGILEVWVPDGLKVARVLVEFEDHNKDSTHLDGFYECVSNKDPRQWVCLRTFAHGNGTGELKDPNWHHALFTPSLLVDLFYKAGFKDVRLLNPGEERGRSHGWINLGVRGVKK